MERRDDTGNGGDDHYPLDNNDLTGGSPHRLATESGEGYAQGSMGSGDHAPDAGTDTPRPMQADMVANDQGN